MIFAPLLSRGVFVFARRNDVAETPCGYVGLTQIMAHAI